MRDEPQEESSMPDESALSDEEVADVAGGSVVAPVVAPATA
jgi:hypothetical protein